MNRGEILDTAKKYVTQDRNAMHGDPEDNFNNIAKLWNAWLEMRNWSSPLTPVDVAVMMDLFKTARIAACITNPENWIDKCGYSACGGGIATLQQEYATS